MLCHMFERRENLFRRKRINYPQLEQAEWLEKLHFIVDMTAHINTLNAAL